MTTATTDSDRTRLAKRILFANTKGGCGKSTLATNLASTYAAGGVPTALIDHDAQASASQWLKRRPESLNPIHGIEAFRKSSAGGTTGNWFMRLPRDIQRVVVDTPAGLQENDLDDQLRQADIIIVPVLPSPIDIQSATRFISTILLNREYRRNKAAKQLVVLANRTRKNTRILDQLDLFLNSLKLPRVGMIRDTQHYVHCSESGTGIIDCPGNRHRQDRQHWLELRDWLESYFDGPKGSGATPGEDWSSKPDLNSCLDLRERVYTVR